MFSLMVDPLRPHDLGIDPRRRNSPAGWFGVRFTVFNGESSWNLLYGPLLCRSTIPNGWSTAQGTLKPPPSRVELIWTPLLLLWAWAGTQELTPGSQIHCSHGESGSSDPCGVNSTPLLRAWVSICGESAPLQPLGTQESTFRLLAPRSTVFTVDLGLSICGGWNRLPSWCPGRQFAVNRVRWGGSVGSQSSMYVPLC